MYDEVPLRDRISLSHPGACKPVSSDGVYCSIDLPDKYVLFSNDIHKLAVD